MNYWNFYERRAFGIISVARLILEILCIGLPFIPMGGWMMLPRDYLKSKSEIAAPVAWHEFSI